MRQSSERFSLYEKELNNISAPGTGCHSDLMKVANYGVLAGVPPDDIFDDIRRNIPRGNRKVSDREIKDTINRALSDHNKGTFVPKPRPEPIVRDGKAVFERLVKKATISTEADLWESSPTRLSDHPTGDTALLLRSLYDPEELIFIGERYDHGVLGVTIRTAQQWIQHFGSHAPIKPFIMTNPLDGILRPKESGDGKTLRGNKNVATFRYSLLEFDNIPIESQVRFWSIINLPIVALIHTGNKSLHAWIDVQKLAPVYTFEAWQSIIKERLYDRTLAPLGVDKACANPARLSRLPGHFRDDKGQYQKLLWFRRNECKIIPLSTSRNS